jgi:uncharacterized protein
MSSSPPATHLRSCLYECRVKHQRLHPRQHRFEYGVFYLWLDLDELDAIQRRLWFLSHNRRNVYSFRDDDHLPEPGVDRVAGPLKPRVIRWLAQRGITAPPDARVGLLTLPRTLGYLFNPVSFYFVQAADGSPICAIAEVGNTFGEMKPYLVPIDGNHEGRFRLVAPKHFYVSPFSEVDVVFDFQLRAPGDDLDLRVNDLTDGRITLTTALQGRRQPLTDAQLAWLTARHPLVTLRVIALIHWEALRLWVKRVPWFRKTTGASRQLDVLRPHASLLKSASSNDPKPSSPHPVQV